MLLAGLGSEWDNVTIGANEIIVFESEDSTMARVSVTWQREDLLLEAENETGNKIILDSSVSVGGKNRGPRPLQLLLMGLAGCTSMDVISILQKMREPLEDFRVVVTADQAAGHPHVYTAIHVEYIATGNVKEESLAKAIELSETRYCSANAMLRQAARISSSYRILPSVPAARQPAQEV
jgi:putative redox protein